MRVPVPVLYCGKRELGPDVTDLHAGCMGAEKVQELRELRVPGLPRYCVCDGGTALEGAQVKDIYLIRHGEATHNVAPKPWGAELIDARLTETGVQQAASLVTRVVDLPIEVVIVSPLTRALETATHGMQPLIERSIPFVIAEECREQYGKNLPDQRRAVSAVAAEFPLVDWTPMQQQPDADTLFTADREPLDALTLRADRFLDLCMARPEQHIAVVTHSSFLAALLNAAVRMTDAQAESAGAWFANAECRHLQLARIPDS